MVVWRIKNLPFRIEPSCLLSYSKKSVTGPCISHMDFILSHHVSFKFHFNIIFYASRFLSCGFLVKTSLFWHFCVCYMHFPGCKVVVPAVCGEQHNSWSSSLRSFIPDIVANFARHFECDLQPCGMMTYLHWNNNACALLNCELLIL